MALYRECCTLLSSVGFPGSFQPLMDRSQALCWLLKEIAGLGYSDIARVLYLPRDEVSRQISSARSALLAFA